MTFSTDSSTSRLEWKFSQVFGERNPGEEVQDVDIITAIEFEKTGDYLAVGDQGGRVVIFESKADKDVLSKQYTQNESKKLDFVDTRHPQFQYKTEFQSHDPEFDYLKSLEIEEKINKLRWCATPNGSLFILSTNDKTIKLWKIKEHKAKKVKEMSFSPYVCPENVLLAERSFVSGQHKSSSGNGYFLEWTEQMANSTSPSHEGHGKDIGQCIIPVCHATSDGETFVSADDLRINLWNLEVSDQCFNIVDMKPMNMEDLTAIAVSCRLVLSSSKSVLAVHAIVILTCAVALQPLENRSYLFSLALMGEETNPLPTRPVPDSTLTPFESQPFFMLFYNL
ncbi:hypothetical protein U1Q18_007267 [Sarracenia purpurea var. burkii]